jgi:hypothetical protein
MVTEIFLSPFTAQWLLYVPPREMSLFPLYRNWGNINLVGWIQKMATILRSQPEQRSQDNHSMERQIPFQILYHTHSIVMQGILIIWKRTEQITAPAVLIRVMQTA